MLADLGLLVGGLHIWTSIVTAGATYPYTYALPLRDTEGNEYEVRCST